MPFMPVPEKGDLDRDTKNRIIFIIHIGTPEKGALMNGAKP